ncbi:MAG TPA: DUF4331 family protein [Stellaceae bacterium]|nr:DUF4331 family protein [Stellaceae bacterium]
MLERLAVSPSDPALRELRALQGQLRDAPDNLVLAIRVAQGYLELGRVTGDPRYAGYSEAALAPWWHLASPPSEVLVLRATLRQRSHQFDAALADLATVLNSNPRNVQARLTRATVLQVQGAYEGAQEECQALKNLTSELVWAACVTGVTASTGRLDESYRQLRAVFDRHPSGQSGLQSWVLTSLAEMAARAGMIPEAESHFRAALAVDAADTYLLGAYADFLLDSNRSPEVIPLLRDKTGADPLLLRYALALQVQHSKGATGASRKAARPLCREPAARRPGAFYKNPVVATELNLVFGVPILPINGSAANDRTDLISILLKYPGQPLKGTNCGHPCAELLRLDLRVPPTAPENQSRLGAALSTDPAGYPNGRRPNDDVTDITVRVVGGTNYINAHIGDGVNFLAGAPGVVGVDITANGIAKEFPFLPTPYDGKCSAGQGSNPCVPPVP